ncbi:MAG: hypothetical protein JW882_14195 [Deltaproteobacteria bacterium]|nr:hypothetical protein [Deltaproteobacteria bacterium]
MGKNSTLLYGVDDKPPFLTSVSLAFQYTLLNIGSMMLTPIIISRACGLDLAQTEYFIFATLLVSAISTFIQVFQVGKIGSGYLMILGPSGAFIACSIYAVNMGGLPLLGIMTLLSAPLEVMISYLIRFVRKIFTPALGGTVIMLVAMLIIPLTIGMWSGEPDDPLYNSPAYFLSGLLPMLVILGSCISDRALVRLWSPIIGVLLGVFTAFSFGIADFSQISEYPVVALPGSGWPGLDLHLSWRHIPLFISFLMATITSTIETFGDTVALQSVSEGKFNKIKYDRIQGGMYVDAVGSMLGGLSGVTANTTYSTVMPVIQLTRVSARVVGYYAALMMLLIAFLPKIAYFFLSIPAPVMGGMSIGFMVILFGEGFKVAASAEVNTENGIVIGTGLTMGLLACIGKFFPELFPDQFRFMASDILTLGGLSALILNIFFIYKIRKTETLSISAHIQRLADLNHKIDTFQDRFRMTEKQKYALQLACEEVFSFFCQQNPDTANLVFCWKYHPDYIITEISACGVLSDVDITPAPAQLEKLSEQDLQRLGLSLLAKVGTHIEHTTISGYHYVQFRVEVR